MFLLANIKNKVIFKVNREKKKTPLNSLVPKPQN